MKNVINSLMTLAAAAAALVSCSRQEVEVKDNSWFVYRFKIVEGQTKATLDQDGVKWEVDKDDVGVIVNDENIRASVVDNNGIKEISFTTESAIAEGTPIYAYYPYSEAVTSADAAQVTIPTNQEGGSVSAMPMAGIPIYLESAAGATSNGTINFLNLGAIIDFRIYSSNANYANETVESVTFKSNSDEVKASGTATIDLTAVQGGENPSAPDMTMSGVSNRRATLKQSVPVAANKDAATTPMYLVVAPGTFSGTVTVNTNVASYTFTLTDKALARNTITKFNMNIGSSKAEREGKTYEYVTDLTEGTYLMVGSETSGSKQGLFVCLFPEAPTKTWTDSQNRTFTGHVLNQMKLDGVATDATSFTTTDATIVASEVELVQSGTSNWLVKVKANNQYLKAPTEDYVITYAAAESGAAAFTAGTVSEGKRNFTTSGGSSGNSTYYFYHSSSADGFSIRTSQTQNMRFYKPSGNPQTISFINVPDGGYTWDIGKNEGTYARPELSGALTTVTYTSDKPTVATVDEKTGVVIFGGTKTGTVTITATAASEDGFASATASYTIKVSNSNVTENIYKKVTAVEVGETYLIVYEGSDTYGPKVFQPTFENNTFRHKSTLDALDVEITTEGGTKTITSSEFDNCQITIEEGYYLHVISANKYLYPNNGSFGAEDTKNSSHKVTLSISSNGTATISRTISWQTYKLRYSSSNSYFESSTNSANVALYKLDDGLTPRTITCNNVAWTLGDDYKVFKADLNNTYSLPSISATPALGGNASIVYNTSDTDVVEIVGSQVKIKSAGTATINVQVTEEGYKPASVSFQLTINKGTQTIAYNPANAKPEYDLVSGDWTVALPTLDDSGVKTQVVYGSSNTNVATVSDQGVVSLVAPITKGATATITATAIESDNYEEASASFTLKVVDSNAQQSVYNKVTSTDDLDVNSKYLIVYENGASSKVFKPILNGSTYTESASNAIGATVSDNTITGDEFDECQVTLEASGSNFFMKAAGSYLYPSSSNIGAEPSPTSSRALSITISNGKVTIKRSEYSHYLAYNSYFLRAGSDSGNLALYKLDDGQPKDRNLAFTPNEVSVSIYEKTVPIALSELATVPTLSGKTDGGVTYSVTCNDTNIPTTSYPTVSATGDVTVNGVGVFTITASAAATPQGTTPAYQAGEASYTLTVTNTAPPTYTFITPSEFVSGGTYLIVSSDANNYNGLDKMRAFAGDAAGTAIEVNGTSGTITGDYSSCEFIISESGTDYTLQGPNGYVTGNADNSYSPLWIQVSNSVVTMSLTDAATLEAATPSTQGNDKDGKVADAFYFYYTKSNGSKDVVYLTKNTSNGVTSYTFKIGGTGRKYGVYLYKKN